MSNQQNEIDRAIADLKDAQRVLADPDQNANYKVGYVQRAIADALAKLEGVRS